MSGNLTETIAVNMNTPKGQKTTAVEIHYDAELLPESVHNNSFNVKDRTITGTTVSGLTITLALDPSDSHAFTREMIGTGPETRTKVTGAHIVLTQREDIAFTDGSILPANDGVIKIDREISPVVDDFEECIFDYGNDLKLVYHIFRPKHEPGEKLPLVVFMHDSSVCSDESKAPLLQGMGGIVWAEPEEQKKRPCYVVLPQYPRKSAFDDFTVTWECEATAGLIKYLSEHEDIDTNRIYGTGQSMGCMMLCELNCNHTDLFAACFLVAGQWQPEKMRTVKDKNLWILVSEGDAKAYPIMGESMRLIEEDGGKVARGSVDAKASDEDKSRFAEDVLKQNANIQFTWYEGESVLSTGMEPNPGAFHLSTWEWAYDVEPIREWLFRQRLAVA